MLLLLLCDSSAARLCSCTALLLYNFSPAWFRCCAIMLLRSSDARLCCCAASSLLNSPCWVISLLHDSAAARFQYHIVPFLCDSHVTQSFCCIPLLLHDSYAVRLQCCFSATSPAVRIQCCFSATSPSDSSVTQHLCCTVPLRPNSADV